MEESNAQSVFVSKYSNAIAQISGKYRHLTRSRRKLKPEERARLSKLCEGCKGFVEYLDESKYKELGHVTRNVHYLEVAVSQGCHLCTNIFELFPDPEHYVSSLRSISIIRRVSLGSSSNSM